MARAKTAGNVSIWTRTLGVLRWQMAGMRYQKEAIFLLILGGSLFYFLAVFDFHPQDPSPFSHSFPPRQVANLCGWIGAMFAGFSHFAFGIGAYLVPIPFLTMGFFLARDQPLAFSRVRMLGWCLLFLVALVLSHFFKPYTSILQFTIPTGGAIGSFLAQIFLSAFGKVGALIVLFTTVFCSTNLISRKPWIAHFFTWARKAQRLPDLRLWLTQRRERKAMLAPPPISMQPQVAVPTPAEISPAPSAPAMTFIERPVETPFDFEDEEDSLAEFEPSNDKAEYVHPPSTIFRSSPALGPLRDEQKREFEATAEELMAAFENFSITGKIVAIQPGPVVTVYEFRPDAGTKISKIMGLIDDIALALKVDSVLMNPVAGKSAIGVQVPNKHREQVYLGDIVNSVDFKQSKSPMTLAMGKSLSGEPVCSDLTTMPHLLAAGATGSGKSVAVNALLCSVILKSTPEEVRMILVDPKMLELSIYEGIPHLLLPVITDPKKASSALRWACYEMERRYKLMQLAKVRHIKGFNQFWDKASEEAKTDIRDEMSDDSIERLPFLLLVIDELADLMLTAPKDVETSIQRLAQKARASGIHLVLATQRPSVDIITGVIKANLPCRISFQTVSKHDSRTILDQVGSEKLLGKGDMLFQRPGTSRLERIQGAFIEDDEVISLVDAIKSDSDDIYDPAVIEWIDREFERSYEDSGSSENAECDDAKFDLAVDIAARQGIVSASFLQRQLKIGYNRAARMVEAMEAQGMVGPADGSKPRKWLGPQSPDEI